jgi:hypothetical protein
MLQFDSHRRSRNGLRRWFGGFAFIGNFQKSYGYQIAGKKSTCFAGGFLLNHFQRCAIHVLLLIL